MRRDIMIFLAFLFIIIGLVFLIQEFYVPNKNVQYKYSTTDFIEPSEEFITCYQDTDCIKIKGSACPASEGGAEVCVNNNHFQEYISGIDEKAGKQEEIICPQVYLVTDKQCKCIEGKCKLM
jgi:hypothetical protein